MPVTSSDLSRRVKDEARRLGFSLAGVTRPDPPPHFPVFERWVSLGRHGAMAYLANARSLERRADPRRILAECRSIVMLAFPYQPAPALGAPLPPLSGRTTAYAWGADYHDVIAERLEQLGAFVDAQAGAPVLRRAYTDTGPLLERDLAQRAGLGWAGKNTCLIHPRQGSYFFLAALLLDVELEPDPPFTADHCGSCTRCIQACPTACILPDRTLDARRCISYLTIELKGPIPPDLRPHLGDWVFGCDVCQQVCPWNVRFALESPSPDGETESPVALASSAPGGGRAPTGVGDSAPASESSSPDGVFSAAEKSANAIGASDADTESPVAPASSAPGGGRAPTGVGDSAPASESPSPDGVFSAAEKSANAIGDSDADTESPVAPASSAPGGGRAPTGAGDSAAGPGKSADAIGDSAAGPGKSADAIGDSASGPGKSADAIGDSASGPGKSANTIGSAEDGDSAPHPYLPGELGLTAQDFNRKFKGSPVRRAKRRGYLRNVAVALGNLGDPAGVPALAAALEHDPEPLVRGHAAWALGQIGGAQAIRALQAAAGLESDLSVRLEIERSISSARSRAARRAGIKIQ